MTLEQTGNYSRWLTETQIRNGFQLANPTSMGSISAIDKAGNPEFKGYFPITAADIGKTVSLLNNWNGDWAKNTKPYMPASFKGGFLEEMEKDLKENPGQPSIWQEAVQVGIVEITEENWQPLASLVDSGLIICLGSGLGGFENWLMDRFVVQQAKMEQPENAFSFRVPTVGSSTDMAYLLASSIFGLGNMFPSQTAFDTQMSSLGHSTFTERMNYIFTSLIGDVSQATWTNVQSQTQGIKVFSQEVLETVVYHGYCSTSPENAGYSAGDLMKVTLNALGSGVSSPFISAVSTANIGSNWAWPSSTSYESIPTTQISYDVWASNSAFLLAVENGSLLLWNKDIAVPSSDTIADLVAQTTPYSGTNTGAFPVLPSSN